MIQSQDPAADTPVDPSVHPDHLLQMAGRARRAMLQGLTNENEMISSDLHAHVLLINTCMSQALNCLSNFMTHHDDCPYTSDLIDAILYVQTARDDLMQGLVKILDDQNGFQIPEKDSSDEDGIVDRVDDQGSPEEVLSDIEDVN